jgi:hypothetical protein
MQRRQVRVMTSPLLLSLSTRYFGGSGRRGSGVCASARQTPARRFCVLPPDWPPRIEADEPKESGRRLVFSDSANCPVR